ncbi:MAG: hypothetical protein CM15mV49_120 [uncultured marine virus]|nr:MAG: hypothetical protein CM15mV49_120 [uncultured marine virus]
MAPINRKPSKEEKTILKTLLDLLKKQDLFPIDPLQGSLGKIYEY